MENNSEIIFVLQGLNDSLTNRQIYFTLALMLYVFTILVNLILIVTIGLETTLHEPMYVFVCNLCVNGICGASSFYPKFLRDLLADSQTITYSGCLTQIFVAYCYVFCEFTNLTVMAYDRYLAICKPLQYQALMSMHKVAKLLLLTWCFSLLETFVGVLLTARLTICSRHVGKIFCTNWEVVKLSCSNTAGNNIYTFVLTFSHLSQTGLILVSYTRLTCLPHLIALLVFATSLLFDVMYSRYGGGTLQTLQNVLAVEFLVIPPLINPIIYGIKLQQIRSRIVHNFTHKPELLRLF
ncbi:hypothetical protein Q8A73_007275 [Channa argus]|nr:hypothetical protein Q8A73_007275 [Channa argus]